MDIEKLKTIQEELNSLFTTIQRLDAQMTENNVAVMNACLGSVKYIYNAIGEILKGSEVNGNANAE